MSRYASLFKAYMDQKGIRYSENADGDLRVSYNADNVKTVEVLLFFDKNGDKYVAFYCLSIGSFTKDQYAKALVVCNTMNKKYRWMKFFIDENYQIVVKADAILDEETCGEECIEYVRRIVGIVDDVYPDFMKARWS